MSDSKSSYGEPVEEPRRVDDVVGSANEGIAEAEAARRDAVADERDAIAADEARADADAQAARRDEIVDDGQRNTSASVGDAASDRPGTPVSDEPADSDASSGDLSYIDTSPETTVDERPARTAAPTSDDSNFADRGAGGGIAATAAYDSAYDSAHDRNADRNADTVAATPVPAPSDPAPEAYATVPVASAAAAPQPIFVQAPEAPIPRGNRGAAGAIGLLAALSFAVLYLAAWLGFGMLNGDVTADSFGADALAALATWSLWVPVVVFFIAFWLLGAIINRGRWAAWVIFGLLVGIASYAGHILGALFQAPFWMMTATEGAELAESQLLAPLAIAAFVIGRELTIWFGAWVAARGARVTELNIEAQREYERTLEAGPQLTRV